LEYIPPDARGRNTLTHYLGNLTYPEILKLSIQFCYGMEYAYSKGVDVHRDIKPDNIMITADKTIKITDFGLAKAFSEKGKSICGTLPYMAPEQFDGDIDRRSDIYAFGITLYQIVADGRLPFVGRTQAEYERLHRHNAITRFSSPFFPIIQKCLEKDPVKRYQDFIPIREKLQQLLLGETGEIVNVPETEEIDMVVNYSNKGASFSNLKKYPEALACYGEALELDPEDAETWCNKAATLMSLGKDQEAIVCLEKALALKPEDILSWNNKALVLLRTGRPEEAGICIDTALKLDPGNAEVWCTKGLISASVDKLQEALGCIEEALKINPNLTQAHELKRAIRKVIGR